MNAPTNDNLPWMTEYKALVERTGLVDLGHRTQIEISGPDRAAWLNNLATNEIRKLPAGTGCEMFLTTAQGKTLAHAFVFVLAESLIIDTVPGQAETILKHLEHYLISEQVTLADRSGEWAELLLAGPHAERLLAEIAGATPPAQRLAHAPAAVSGCTIWVRRADLVGPVGFLISGEGDDIAQVRSRVCDAGAAECGDAAFEAARIEWGFPWFGVDLSDNNLPQEVARDASAISFVKGCYLGQETVARIDAMGHVNKTLVGVRFSGAQVPAAGLELSAADRPAGQVTSATYSPRLGAPLALAYVRRGSNAPGARLTSSVGDAEVVTLPAA